MTSERFHTSGANNWQPRPPMTEARRQALYGRIEPMAHPRHSIWRRLFDAWGKSA